MNRTIEQLIKYNVDTHGIDEVIRRYSIMKKDLNKAVDILEDEHMSVASVLTDIDYVLDCVIESIKYNRPEQLLL
jgi:hypothetical protein